MTNPEEATVHREFDRGADNIKRRHYLNTLHNWHKHLIDGERRNPVDYLSIEKAPDLGLLFHLDGIQMELIVTMVVSAFRCGNKTAKEDMELLHALDKK